MKREKLRKILSKSQSNFQHYVKKIEAQANKNGFLIKKRVYNIQKIFLTPNQSFHKGHVFVISFGLVTFVTATYSLTDTNSSYKR